jgi:uncharacterized membrane protein
LARQENDFTYVIIYLLTWITGIIFFVISGNDKRKKQHSIQAIMLGVIGFILGFIPRIGYLFVILVWLYGLYIGYMASINKEQNIPYITEFAKQYA